MAKEFEVRRKGPIFQVIRKNEDGSYTVVHETRNGHFANGIRDNLQKGADEQSFDTEVE